MLSRKTKKIISLGLAAAISNSVAISAVSAKEVSEQNESVEINELVEILKKANDEVKNDQMSQNSEELNENYIDDEEYELENEFKSSVTSGPGAEVDNPDDEVVESDFEFENYYYNEFGQIADGIRITKYTGNETEVTIPSTINNIPVKAIGCNAFSDSNVVKVVIEDGIEIIEDRTFSNCKVLRSIEIPQSVTRIYYEVFEGSTRLKDIKVAEANTKYKVVDGVLYTKDGLELIKYPSAKSDSEFTIPDSVITIDINAFDECNKLKKIYFTENISKIRSGAFNLFSTVKYYVPNMEVRNLIFDSSSNIKNNQIIVIDGNDEVLTSDFVYCKEYDYEYNEYIIRIDEYNGNDKVLKIPSTIEGKPVKSANIVPSDDENNTLEKLIIPDTIEEIQIQQMENLKNIEVSEYNNYYTTIDGVLFSKDKSSLIHYPSGITNTEYTVPDNTEVIKHSAIGYSKYLETIKIPSSVKTIYFNGIGHCEKLKNISVNEGNEHYKDLNGILYSKDESTLVKMPSMRSGENYTVPNHVRKINEAAFIGCRSMKTINIHDKVEKIGMGAFGDCYKLLSINVNENNENYKDIYGVLFDKSGKTLIQYPLGNNNETYVIPNGVTTLLEQSLFSGSFKIIEMPDTVEEIGDHTFAYCTNLQKIKLSNSLKKIEARMFAGCESLKSIVIPEGVTSIDNGIFDECDNLKYVSLPSTLTDVNEYAFEGVSNNTIFYVANEDVKDLLLIYSDISEDKIVVGEFTEDKDTSSGTGSSSGGSSSSGSSSSGSSSSSSSSSSSNSSSSESNSNNAESSNGNNSNNTEGTNKNESSGTEGTWVKNTDGTWAFNNKDGEKVVSQWVQDNGKWYYLNENGTMKTGWHQDANGTWYNLSASGEMNSGWLKDTNGKWYFLNDNGSMATGWVKDNNNKWYFLNNSGDMATGWVKDANNKWYFLNDSGDMATGWLKDTNGKWYFLNENGDMQSSGWKTVNGKWYYFYDNGEMASNTTINGYKVNANGEWV
ncbi:MAG TPA: hypothetical protein DG753_03395 [Clostridium sp.]|nr:hypothetical protein [Clostridium sp.]